MSDTPGDTPPPTRILRPPLTIMRRIFAAVGVIIMVLTGGCTLFFIFSLLSEGGSESGAFVGVAIVYGGLPFLVGLGVFLLATRAGR